MKMPHHKISKSRPQWLDEILANQTKNHTKTEEALARVKEAMNNVNAGLAALKNNISITISGVDVTEQQQRSKNPLACGDNLKGKFLDELVQDSHPRCTSTFRVKSITMQPYTTKLATTLTLAEKNGQMIQEAVSKHFHFIGKSITCEEKKPVCPTVPSSKVKLCYLSMIGHFLTRGPIEATPFYHRLKIILLIC